jgi:hypothetical protein
LWDDPLLGINWNNMTTVNPGWVELALKNYRKMLSALERPDEDNKNADVRHGKLAAEVLMMKIEFRQALLKAYATKNKKELKNLSKAMVPAMTKVLKRLLKSFRTQWMRRNKPFGFEVIQLRLNAQIGRYEEIAVRIKELLDSKISGIAELDEPVPNVHAGSSISSRFFASGSTII